MPSKKQAVVFVHGMGEQRPMETLRSFVKTIWQKDTSVTGSDANNVWVKPDAKAGLQELRRITTGPGTGGKRTDFFEFYWADLMQGTTWQHVSSWISGLLIRSPLIVPRNVFFIWMVLWTVALVAFGVFLVSILKIDSVRDTLCPTPQTAGFFCTAILVSTEWIVSTGKNYGQWLRPGAMWISVIAVLVYFFDARVLRSWKLWPTVLLAVLLLGFIYFAIELVVASGSFLLVFTALFGGAVHVFLVRYFGDVARYVRATPSNVHQRKLIRQRGLDLLRTLHGSGEYDRIIVVSHSLGTIIAYDLLSLLWSEIGPVRRNPPSPEVIEKLDALNDWVLEASKGDWDVDEYQLRQREVSRSLARGHCTLEGSPAVGCTPWLISDFVTLGSPLTHAEFLLTRDEKELDKLVAERTLPISPPVLEGRSKPSFLYRDNSTKTDLPHHASVFAAVRWTNIYDPHRPFLFFLGDAISGPVNGHFSGLKVVGPDGVCGNRKELEGIRDVRVCIKRNWPIFSRLFTHTQYWSWSEQWKTSKPPQHIDALRNAVRLNESG